MEDIKESLLSFFRGLTFNEEEHKYSINGNNIKKSVSVLIKDFCIPFDKEKISKIKSERENISQQELLDSWKKEADDSIVRGKQAHLFGEIYAFNRTLRPQSMFDVAIMKFWNDLPKYVIPIVTELQMYHKKKLYAGTADIILYNTKTNKFIIGDYKTNKDLFKNFKGQKLQDRFSNFLDTPFNKYQLQLSYYQILLEQAGVEISNRKIIWLKPDGNYEIYNTQDLTQYLK